ncbi:CHASE2 domain-containing protein [Treponema parvum]|uniref:CHASE2 domain-containing protein n=1 Tax=Treponema parvum TaxID=138851 RepID=UPI001AEBE046|nr:CHASE2 domain-containing protein [Treponema parvum]QTQ15464.1 CHASE2 domain-containing protein [Treponema parvum]
MSKRKNSSNFKSPDIIVALCTIIVIGFLTLINVFEKIEYRLYDVMLKFKPAPQMQDKMMLVNIDDESLEQMGAWPWTRDVLADALIRMRELGAYSATFDIEYLSPSQMGINPSITTTIPENFSENRKELLSLIYELSDSVSKGKISLKELPDMTDMLVNEYIDPQLETLERSVTEGVFRDNDDYFSKAIRFFGNTWLTINAREVLIQVDEKLKDFAKERFLLSDVTDPDGLIAAGNKYQEKEDDQKAGFSPALYEFLKNARGAGFTNVVVDSDGSRRRVELLQERDGKYIAQLLFAPMLNMLDTQSLVRTKRHLIIKNALFPGETKRRDIKIPLDKHGRMLINWVKQLFNERNGHTGELVYFKGEPVYFLKYLDDLEKSFTNNLRTLLDSPLRYENGKYLDYYDGAKYLLQTYSELEQLKAEIFNETADASGKELTAEDSLADPRIEQLFEGRRIFFEECGQLFDGSYEKQIIDFLESYRTAKTSEAIDQNIDWFKNTFEVLKTDYDEYRLTFKLKKEKYNGAFCLIGNSASGTTDLGVTPFERLFPNVGTHANIFNTIMTGQMITPFSWGYGFAVSAILLIIIIFASRKAKAFMQSLIGIGGCIIFPLISFSMFSLKLYYIPVLAPTLVMTAGYIAITIQRFLLSEKDKRFLRNAFSTYLSESVVNEIVNDPSKLTLGGEEKNLTAIFTDIKGFSTISERVTPTQLVSFLNKYLTLFSDIILEHQGTIDKYEGDAIVGFFGAPISFEDHAWRACYSAIRMKQAEKIFNKEMTEAGIISSEINTRIGINTGAIVVGNMGTDKKMNYTMMGNAVNLAARLEGVNKVYHTWILVSESTWDAANSGENSGKMIARRLDKVRVIGINTPVQLYNIVGFTEELPKEEIDSVEIFHKGLDLYLAKDFANAKKFFDEADAMFPQDEVSKIFSERCEEKIKTGVPDNWDGVMSMTSK